MKPVRIPQDVTGYKSRRNESWSINPHTNIDLLEDTINDIDLVCIMSVNPGFEVSLS
jgi:pentose-5-phosphate-3-epimerase